MSVAVTFDYRPRPAQQGSVPQIGVLVGEAEPAGNQQQQPLQSVHPENAGSGLHTALHAEASPPVFDCAASIVPVDPELLPLLLPVDAAASSVDPLDPDPLSSPEEPPVLLELLQAARPTVDDAPMTTMT